VYTVRFSARVSNFCQPHSVQAGSGIHPACYSVGMGAVSGGGEGKVGWA
jgi:hypothetical protein